MPSDPNINPFQSPQAELDERTRASGEAETRRRRGLRRETTLRAMGAVKLASVFLWLGVVVLPFLRPGWFRNSWPPSSPVALALALLGGLVGLGLIRLRMWALLLQGLSNGAGAVVAVVFLVNALADLPVSDRAAAAKLFSGMLLLAVNTVLGYLVLSRAALRVTSADYARTIAETRDWPIGNIVGFKVILLGTLWIADLAALGMGLFVR